MIWPQQIVRRNQGFAIFETLLQAFFIEMIVSHPLTTIS